MTDRHRLGRGIALTMLALACSLSGTLVPVTGARAAPAGKDQAPTMQDPSWASPTRDVKLYVKKPRFVIEEYHLVKPGKEQEVINWYLTKLEPVLKTYPGYLGMEILSTQSDGSVKDPEISRLIGLPDKVILPHLGIMIDGEVRTDKQINLHAMLRGQYNLMYRHYLADEDSFKKLMEGHERAGEGSNPESLPGRWKKMYGTELWDTMAKEYFVNLDNHYDVVYRFVYSD